MIYPEPPPAFDRKTKQLILHITMELWNSVLTGNRAPINEERYLRMSKPQRGDLVVETSTAYFLLRRDSDLTDSKWDAQLVTFVYTTYQDEEAHVCLTPDRTTFNWVNASLIAVPPFITQT